MEETIMDKKARSIHKYIKVVNSCFHSHFSGHT